LNDDDDDDETKTSPIRANLEVTLKF